MTTADQGLRYPSRLGVSVPASERQEPVVWGEEPSGPLDGALLEEYDRNGVVVVPGYIPLEQVRQWRGEAEALCDDPRQDIVHEQDGKDVRTIFKVDRNARCFARAARDPRLLGVARQILASPAYVHQSRINFKRGFTGGDFWWHSDFEIWHTEDGMPAMRALTVSVLLEESSRLNGPIMFVPGSHRLFVPCINTIPDMDFKRELVTQDYTAPDPELLKELIRGRGIVEAVGGPGTLIVSDCNTMHGSAANISPWPRAILFYCYNSIENTLPETTPLGSRPRPDYLAHRDFRPLSSLGELP